MFEITRYESERRIRGTIVLVVLLAVYAAAVLAIAPDLVEQYQKLATTLPQAFQKMFGISGMSTLAGFLSVEFYQFGWLIVLGLYAAYSAGSLVADDVETGRMDTLLSSPISRSKVVVEKFLSLLLPIVAVNVVVGLVVYAGTGVLTLDESITLADVVAVHVLSIPYLLCCAGIGLGMSVGIQHGSTAKRASAGIVFGLYMLESLVIDTNYEWIGTISPTRYYEPTAILVAGEYDVTGALILLGAAIVLVVASQFWFRQKDIQ